jgi:hypothetical protein
MVVLAALVSLVEYLSENHRAIDADAGVCFCLNSEV